MLCRPWLLAACALIWTNSALAAEPVKGPVAPEESLKYLQVDPGLTIELVAAEPDVIDPVAAAFDEKGRLWVVEMTDYPNGPKADGPPLSRIRILTPLPAEPGRFGRAKTFIDKLLFANGLMHWDGGVIVTTDGSVQYFKDENGDDVADKKEVWFSGFEKGNPQLRCNHPTLGLDGKIYVANGLRGGKIVADKEKWGKEYPPVSISGMDFCFDPFTGECEAVSGLGQFGLCFDDWGNRFVCSNRNPCRQIVLEDRDIKRNPNLVVPSVMEEVCAPAEKSHIYAISRPWTTSTLHAGQFTAACGLSIYRGDGLPKAYYGNVFVCEPTANVVHREAIERTGSVFRAVENPEQREFLASRDEWFRPVYTFSGPDGALYVCDMYRAVIEHPEYMPEELKTRPDLTLGNDRGRIYRVTDVANRGQPLRWNSAKAEDDVNVIRSLRHANGWHRDTVARLAIASLGVTAAMAPWNPDLEVVAEDLQRTSAAVAVQLLSLRAFKGDMNERMVAELLLPGAIKDPRVLEALVRIAAARFPESIPLRDLILAIRPDQPDGALRFRVALALGEFAMDEESLNWLAAALVVAPDDTWLAAAVATAVPKDGAKLAMKFWERRLSRDPEQGAALAVARLERTASLFQAAASQSDDESVQALLTQLFSTTDERATPYHFSAAVQGIGRGLKNRGKRFSQFFEAMPEPAQTGLRQQFLKAAEQLRCGAAGIAELDHLRLLAFAPSELTKSAVSSRLVSPDQEVMKTAIEALGASDDPEVSALLLDGYGRRSPALRSLILGQLLVSEDRIESLVTAMETGVVSIRELDSGRLAVLQRQKAPELKARIEKLVKAAAPADRSTVLADYQPALAMKGDPLRGREIFAKNCVTCHKIGDLGVNVAPDIADSRVKTPVQLLTDILDPNKAIDNNYFSYTVIDLQGQIHSGILSAETASSVTLKQPENKTVSILRSEVDEIRSNGVSLMPVGLEKVISVEQMADLISFIKNWRYLDGQVPKEVIR
jgi:putative membrane-bound dehydrogenase-like protein